MSGPIDVYARVSRLRAKDQTSTTAQVAVCRSVLRERGLPEGEIHVDDGKSAWDPTVYRDGWEALMARLESGEASGVIVYDLERFTRQPDEASRLIRAATRGMLILDSDQALDLSTSSGIKAFRDAAAAAEYYSNRLRDKVRRGKAAKAREGRVDARRMFGFEADGITIQPEEAAIIRDHARRLLAGETQADLIRELETSKVPTMRGAAWSYAVYRGIMLRLRNAGLIEYKGEVAGTLPGEPILDRLTYDRLVALYASRKPGRPRSPRYVLSSLAECGECGALLAGRPVYGTPRRQYWCASCYRIFIDAERLDTWVGDYSIRVLRDEARMGELARLAQEADNKRQELLRESSGIELTLTEIGARLGRQELSLARHDAICAPLEKRQGEIRAELVALAEAIAPLPQHTIPERDMAHVEWLDTWVNGSPNERRSMVIRALDGRRLIVDRAPRNDRLTIEGRVRVILSKRRRNGFRTVVK